MQPLTPPPGFLSAAESLGIAFDPGDVDRLGRYLALLLETNKTHNLTAITDPDEAWTKHILDALTLVPLIAGLMPDDGSEGADGSGGDGGSGGGEGSGGGGPVRIIDVGAGGGVPGIPLAIVLPGIHVSLLEATTKKADFLRRAASELGLDNVAVINDRAERIGQDRKAHRERYDAAIARAVGHLAVVAELAAPLVRVGGVVLAVKGAKAEQELAEAAKALTTVRVAHVQTVQTPTGRIVVLEKISPTPRDYPRRNGEPKRCPLGIPKPRP